VAALARGVGGAVLLVLVVEASLAFPNYIAYFNPLAGDARGRLHWLGDSNLDWGQDLKRLAAWQRDHPEVDLHLAYYGQADPAYYGIRYANLPGGVAPPETNASGTAPASPAATSSPARRTVFAVSATILQGIYSEQQRRFYEPLRMREPREVIGGSIYLFDVPSP
jgi:hypothetical protein